MSLMWHRATIGAFWETGRFVMRSSFLSSLVLVMAMSSYGAGQGHEGHGSPSPAPPLMRTPTVKAPRLPELITRSNDAMEAVKRAVGGQDEALFVDAVDSYTRTLLEFRDAMRSRESDDRQFEADLAAAEKALRRHMEGFGEMLPSIAENRMKKLDEASLGAGRTLDAVLIWQETIKSNRRPAPRASRGGAEAARPSHRLQDIGL